MYTHKLHIDEIGSSGLMILTAWRNHSLTRPEVDLFPPKLDKGLNGHRLTVSAFEQPPFVLRKYTIHSLRYSVYDSCFICSILLNVYR